MIRAAAKRKGRRPRIPSLAPLKAHGGASPRKLVRPSSHSCNPEDAGENGTHSTLDLKAQTSSEIFRKSFGNSSNIGSGIEGSGITMLTRNLRELGKGPGALGSQTAREWAMMQEIERLEHMTIEERRRREAKQLRQDNLAELNLQRKHIQNEKAEFNIAWKRWGDEIEEDAMKYREEEERKRDDAREVRRKFDQERRRQLEQSRLEQQIQKEAEAKEGQAMLRRAKEEALRADEEEAKKKRRNREDARKMAEQAKIARSAKEQQRLEEAKRDREAIKAQQELLEKQDKERNAFFEKLKAKQGQLLAAYEKGVGNELEKKAAEDDERAKRYQEVKLREELKVQEAKEKRLNELKLDQKIAIGNQLEEHVRQRQQRQKEETELLGKMRANHEKEVEKEKAKEEQKKQALYAHAEYLRRQIAERTNVAPQNVARDKMNAVERQMNKEKLDRAEALMKLRHGKSKRGALTAR
eukprot:TRINITY_DN26534_c0_g1_i2.p1 TRINITY_DN26534_c0_g1~~TRINITY_DN26534_c0_g1_i2.p1  ORF type:complete len:469 (-),score=150.42 TRINITY_DN26534_c0_g1_i2:81-1487(-)